LSQQATSNGGEVSAEQVDALGRLARLAEICDAVKPPPARKRWPVIGLFGLTLVGVSILFLTVPETEIEVDVKVSEVGFALTGSQALAEAMGLATVGASGLQEVRLPRMPSRSAEATSDGWNSTIQLSVAGAGARRGTLTLAKLALPAETRVWLRTTEVPNQYRLSFKGPRLALDLPVRIDVHGPVRLAGPGGPGETLDFVSPRPITLQAGPDQVDLDLTFAGNVPGAFLPQLRVRDLSLFQVEGYMEPGSPGVRRLSTVLGGSLYLESLNGTERRLRAGEGLRFERSEGEIRTLRLAGDHIALDFRGRVRGMATGSDDNPRSLMPTILEWLRARQGLALLWGTALYVVGVVMTAVRWWRNPT
jgi:hypothetical protein